MKMTNQELEDYYSRAIKAFKNCIEDEENKFLKTEIHGSIDLIIPKKEYVKIQFRGAEENEYWVEVKIHLYFSNANNINSIGYYYYYEDKKGQPLDDKLVFE